jgi:predicted ATP-dependent endonuclease of OLD family
MRLLSVRIQDFRCIEDSTEFPITDVTCLVGKNESGKTALLKALYKLKPDVESKAPLEPATDYPKRKWRPEQPIPANPPAVTTKWRLDAADVAALEKQFGAGIIADQTFTLTKGYDNQVRLAVKTDDGAAVKHLIGELKLSEEEKAISGGFDLKSIQKAVEEAKEIGASQQKLLTTFKQRYPNDVNVAVITAVYERVPTFLYFDNYLTLPGIVSVDALTNRKAQNQMTDQDRVFLAVLALAGTSLDRVHGSGTYEEFNSKLRAVSNQVTDQIFKYWSQNKHLDVDMRLDAARTGDKPPFNSGWIFRTRIDNRRHRADTSFDERSSGFVWFFSFLVWFNQLKQTYGNNLIILLDEPGLSLHARAQNDLLRYINEQLRPYYQVIYTTHSPFMIDADNLLSARTVEDVVKKEKQKDGENFEHLLGTKVSADVLSTDPDTVSPLQRVLDYEITQTLFVGKHTLLVEGSSDLLYLKWFSSQLEKAGKPGLDYRWVICSVRGIDRIPGFVSLFRGNNLHIAAVVDVQAGHKQKIEHARKSLEDKHLLTLDNYTGQTEADIEDVLGRDLYVTLVNETYDLRGKEQVPAAKPAGAPERVTKEVQAHFAILTPRHPEFSHEQPAERLFQGGDEGTKLPGFKDALRRMEKLIGDLNALMP